jgi:antitoxin (DNA-binding transcriptional repressor) of toxin-antitoxin stability system
MKTVGIKELRNRLSEYMETVRRGEVILVTDHGEVVAELWPPTRSEACPSLDPGLASLAPRGILSLGKPNSPSLYSPLPPLMASGSAAKLRSKERQDRR